MKLAALIAGFVCSFAVIASAKELTESVRQEIYRASWRAGMKGSKVAGTRFPFSSMPSDPESNRKYLAERKAIYNQVKAERQASVMRRYKIDRPQLAAIDKEGMAKKWPLGAEEDPSDDEPAPAPAEKSDTVVGREYYAQRAGRAASLYKMAENLERQQKRDGALNFYREIAGDYSDTPEAKKAAARIKFITGK